jgi:DNA-binding response OmpR family regulator
MTPEQLSRLFQAFSQADASTTRKFGGTGLGLAITKHFCVMMGGDIQVESAYERGTTFTIRLPAEVRETRPEPVGATENAASARAETTVGTVLVIDDEPLICDLVQRFLIKDGFQVEVAYDGETGLKRARDLHPDAITLDVILAPARSAGVMPGLDGWAVLAALKADPALADIPVILVSIVDDKPQGAALGAADYLTKPIDRDRLAATVRKNVREYRARRMVLIVEDDATTRDMVRRALEKEGWTIVEAENGRVALERVAENRPSLILLDLMMPEIDGFGVVAELRQRADWRTIPVIVMTAKDLTPEDKMRLDGCVAYYFQKGEFNRDELSRQVRELVAARAHPEPAVDNP